MTVLACDRSDRTFVYIGAVFGGTRVTMKLVAAILAVTLAGAFANDKGSNKPVGAGAYAYQDSAGNRYGGTFDIGEDDIPDFAQYAPGFPSTGFSGGFPPGFPFSGDTNFVPEFFKNLQSCLEDAFPDNPTNQRAAYKSVNMAFDNTFNQAGGGGGGGGRNPYYDLGQQYAAAGMQNFAQYGAPPTMGNYQHPQGGNSAYAAGATGPQGTRQIASISPANPNRPNIDVSSGGGGGGGSSGDGGFYSVSSSSYAHSSDVGGRKTESRGAKTVVNNNGDVKEYEVHS